MLRINPAIILSQNFLYKLLIFFNPIIKKGNVTSHQKIAHSDGKKPSMMCIAKAGLGTINNNAKK